MGATWTVVSPAVEKTADYFICACTYHGRTGQCTECAGRGVVRIDHDAVEMHLTYGNTHRLMAALGYPCDPDAYVGNLTYHQVISIVHSQRLEALEGEMRERYYSALSSLLACALYHKAGINWG